MDKIRITLGLLAATLLNVCGCAGFYGSQYPLEAPAANQAARGGVSAATGTATNSAGVPGAAGQPTAANQSGAAGQSSPENDALLARISKANPELYRELIQARQKMAALQSNQQPPTSQSAGQEKFSRQNNRAAQNNSPPSQQTIRPVSFTDRPPSAPSSDREQLAYNHYRPRPREDSTGAFVNSREMLLPDAMRRHLASRYPEAGGMAEMENYFAEKFSGKLNRNVDRASYESWDKNRSRRDADSENQTARAERDNDREASKRDSLYENEEEEDEPITPGQWRKELGMAIGSLEKELHSFDGPKLDPKKQTQMEILLRLLYAADNRREEALGMPEGLGLSEDEREYWKHQLHSLLITMDENGSESTRRASLAMRELRDAARHLAAVSTLDLRNLAFCSAVDGFGQYTEFDETTFKPDQETLLYFEVDNFTVSETTKGHTTKLQGTGDIIDADGVRVASLEFPLAEETVRNPRRDYFIRYRVYIPKNLSPGEYTLQLMVEDQLAQKFGQSSIVFKVKDK